ncbi:hypothetical protein NDU88_004323 [Pleurodeles waltl]|uniref:Uncharacterized protein n=1 Tax=Pleurodeles waltl TaxID=8319 RepID=A0AAV7WRN3_PLEWA|nr:hypothetical protein NDU88_004323 [Pleurodeles waltl]
MTTSPYTNTSHMCFRGRNQALPTLENSGERREPALEEKDLGGAGKMAATTDTSQDSIVIISDDKGEGQGEQMSEDCGGGLPTGLLYSRDGRLMQLVPRLVSPMLHKVQEWEVANQTGEQVEFVDISGVVMRGTICGEASGDGKSGMAQVRLDFWQPVNGASQSGCDSPHVLGGHEDQVATRLLGQPACGKRLPVRVGAFSGHRLEERARPGAVRLTPGDVSSPGSGIQDFCPGAEEVPSTSRGAGFRYGANRRGVVKL